MASNTILWELKASKVKNALAEGKRLDGRKLDEYRPIEIVIGKYENAEGSALIKLGETEIAVGVKMEIGTPFPDTPDQGSMGMNVELTPLASPRFESGPPTPEAVELSRVVDRSIRESGCIDFSKLCISPGEAILLAFIDGVVLNYDGNMYDTAQIGAMAALINTKMPKVDENHKKVKGEYDGMLELNNIPTMSTFAKIGEHVVVDPSLVEEMISDARYSIATLEDGSIHAIQKGGSGSFTFEEVNYIVDTAVKRGKEIREIIKNTKQ